MINNKQYMGYINIGAPTKQDAKNKIGIQIYQIKKPNIFRRLCLNILLGFHWINEILINNKQNIDITNNIENNNDIERKKLNLTEEEYKQYKEDLVSIEKIRKFRYK